jgi:hypothetical protein
VRTAVATLNGVVNLTINATEIATLNSVTVTT